MNLKSDFMRLLYKMHVQRLHESEPDRWRRLGAKIGQRVFAEQVSIEERFAPLLTIEDNVVIAAETRILLHDSALNNLCGLPVKFGQVIIRRGSYIGRNCTILCGVEIGEGALIGAGALVVGAIPAGVVAYGIPAKVVGTVAELRERFIQNMEIDRRFAYLDVPPWHERVGNSTISSKYEAQLKSFLAGFMDSNK